MDINPKRPRARTTVQIKIVLGAGLLTILVQFCSLQEMPELLKVETLDIPEESRERDSQEPKELHGHTDLQKHGDR